MQTTEVVVEMIVVGGGLAIAGTPIIALLMGISTSQLLSSLDLKELIVVAITAVYPLGIVWNRLSDWVFSGVDNRILKQNNLDISKYHEDLVRIDIASANSSMRLYQVRSVYRIARSSTLSFALAAVTIPVGTYFDCRIAVTAGGALFISLMMLTCAAGSYWAWRHLRGSYLDWIIRAARILDQNPT